MDQFAELDEDNFLIFAIKHYDNPECNGMSDFEEDINICVYVKRLLRKYKKTGELKERLVLNHIITLYNLFGSFAATKILLYKIEPDLHHVLKTFLSYLNYIPTENKAVYPEQKYLVSLNLDEVILKKLKEL
jgi:hypothetical protein